MRVSLKRVKRIVAKIGTNSLTEDHSLSDRKMRKFVDEMMRLKEKNCEVIIVSSGAIAAGMSKLGLRQKPRDIKVLQATAAVGQNELMRAYEKHFSRHKQTIAQVLLTRKDFVDRRSYLNIRNTLMTLLKSNVVPIINENDTVSVEEIESGDNDTLSEIVAVNVGADLLIIYSTTGFHMRDEKGEDAGLIPLIESKVTAEMRKAAGGASASGRGGMVTKISVAEKAMNAGITVIIADSSRMLQRDAIEKVMQNMAEKTLIAYNSTLCMPNNRKITEREHWMRHIAKPAGTLRVDEGAKKAITERGGSLLPSGIVDVEGSFDEGDSVSIVDKNGLEIARGITNYRSDDVKAIMGLQSKDIEKALGRRGYSEVIWRGNMVLL